MDRRVKQKQYINHDGGFNWLTNLQFTVADAAITRASTLGIQILTRAGFNTGRDKISLSQAINNLKSSSARVILYGGDYDDLLPILSYPETQSLIGDEFVWIVGESAKGIVPVVKQKYPEMVGLLKGLLVVYPVEIDGETGRGFEEEYKNRYGSGVEDYAGFNYDCLLGMVLGYDRVVKEGKASVEEIGESVDKEIKRKWNITNVFF